MDIKEIEEQWDDFLLYVERRDVIFYYVGYFSQSITSAMAESIKLRVKHAGAEAVTRKRLFSSFVEMAQNIVHYSSEPSENALEEDMSMRRGAVYISSKDGRYYLYCANPVKAEIAQKLREKLEHLRSLTIDEIKSEYKKMLRSETPADSKGAGLGLLTMARDASAPLDFTFTQTPVDGTSMFYLRATI